MFTKKQKIIITILLLIISPVVYVLLVLYMHNMLFYLNFEIVVLLLKNNINILKLVMIDANTELHITPNSIDEVSFYLLIYELSDGEIY